MRLTLHVPGLLLPREILADTVFDLALPGLALLLARAHHAPLPEQWLPLRFGLERLPAAALRNVDADRIVPSSAEWLALDPVHFDVRRAGIVLTDPAQLDLTTEESAALLATVAPLLADWGELATSAPQRWELRLARPLALKTLALPEAIDLPVGPTLPGGADGRVWRRLLTEIQTVLHTHPVNRAREAQGRPTANSLWPWGGGALPKQVEKPCETLWSNDPVLAGLGRLAGVDIAALPPGYFPARGRVLADATALQRPAARHDALTWRAALLGLERDWLTPVIASMKRGECARCELVAAHADGSGAVALRLERGDLRRFWRRPRPPEALAKLA